jgi:LysR family nitrogen assimilation transcriptional regulator
MGVSLELKALQALVKVAELGNISQAAISLGLTQSSLSRIISAIERDFGSPLFYRTGRGVALTELGESTIPRIRNIVLSSEQLLADVRDGGQEPSGVVTLALMPTLTGAIAEPLFDEVQRNYPGIGLRMLEGFSANIAAWLGEGRADIGLLSRYGPADARQGEVLATSHLMLVGARGAEKSKSTVRFRELDRFALVLPANPNGTRVAIERVARKLQVKLNVAVEADSLEAQKAIIGRHDCFTITDPKTVEAEVASGRFMARTIVAPKILRRVVISATNHRPLSRAARQVMTVIRRLYGLR